MDVTIKLCEVIIVLHRTASVHPLGVFDICHSTPIGKCIHNVYFPDYIIISHYAYLRNVDVT